MNRVSRLCFIGMGSKLTVMRLVFCLVTPLLRASGKDKTMKIKVFNYALWRDEATGTYYTKVNGITTEISKEVYYELMSHENEDRYDEAMSLKRKLCYGHPLGDSYDLCDEVPDPTTWKKRFCLKSCSKMFFLGLTSVTGSSSATF